MSPPEQQSETFPIGEPSSTAVEQTRLDSWLETYDIWIRTPVAIIWDDWRGRIGVSIMLAYLLMAAVGALRVSTTNYAEGPRSRVPFETLAFPLGTNGQGIGLFGQIMNATWPMLQMIFAGALFATSVAILVGVTSGYVGGRIDQALMTITDIMLTLPGLPLTLVIASYLDNITPIAIGLILAINDWVGLARQLRSEVLSIREESYVEASQSLGIGLPTILLRDVLPNVMPFVTIRFMSAARNIIFGAVGLYFLGLLPFERHNWGTLLNQAYQSGQIWNPDVAHKFWVPLITILLFSLGLIYLAQSLDQIFNPRIKARRSKTVASDDEEIAAE